jgi:hypothetical protein
MPPPPAPPSRPLVAAFRIVYRVDDVAGSSPLVSTERVEVRRPFDSRVEQWEGPPPGTAMRSANVSNRDALWTLDENGAVSFAVRRVPAVGSRGVSRAALDAAARSGNARVAGRETILGRACTRFVYREPYKPAEPATPKERAESCVTSDGLLLKEAWTFAGKLARVVEAVEIAAPADLPDERFFVGQPLPETEVSRLASANLVVDEGSAPAGHLTARLPRGFVSSRKATASQPGAVGAPGQTFSQSYVRGTELVVVDQSVPPSSPAWDPREGDPIKLGTRGGRIVFYADRVEVRMRTGTVDARVTAPTRELAVYVARTLR